MHCVFQTHALGRSNAGNCLPMRNGKRNQNASRSTDPYLLHISIMIPLIQFMAVGEARITLSLKANSISGGVKG